MEVAFGSAFSLFSTRVIRHGLDGAGAVSMRLVAAAAYSFCVVCNIRAYSTTTSRYNYFVVFNSFVVFITADGPDVYGRRCLASGTLLSIINLNSSGFVGAFVERTRGRRDK